MGPTPGKRKRITREELEEPSRSPSPSSESEDSNTEDLQAIFRRAFEAKFKPLDMERKRLKVKEVNVEEEQLEEESDWSGISSEEEDQVEVVEYADTRQADDQASKAEMRAFMSSKPPTSSAPATSKPSSKSKKEDADPTEATHLKNDLALQKLLRDSHLLSCTPSTSGSSTPNLSLTGTNRHKSTDLHLQSLGAKTSIFTQKKMPMAQRKHEAAKARMKEEKRRAEARENGVILEKEKKEKKALKGREKGVGGPSVGRFKGGTLTLSKRDVASITGGGGGGGKWKSKKGRR